MILPDINLLVYALDESSPRHDRARLWWEARLNGTRMICLPWVVILGLIRLLTNPRIYQNPYAPAEILSIIESWLALPHVRIIHPSEGHFQLMRELIEQVGTAGNLTTDVHLAALAIDRGLVLHSHDTDFARFPKLKRNDPPV